MPCVKPISTSDSFADADTCMPDYVTLMLVNPDGPRVLMTTSADAWILPHFTYPNSLRYHVDRCCSDLQESLDVDAARITAFSAAVELLGSYASVGFEPADEIGFARLFIVESHLDPLPLPATFAWKNAQFLSSCLDSLDKQDERYDLFDQTLRYIGPQRHKALSSLTDPRYRLGWFAAASEWFRSVVLSRNALPSGRVIQVHVSPTSTLLKLNTSHGWFYLKAPALGTNEASITTALAHMMPTHCIEVAASCDELNCFVMPGFERFDVEQDHLFLMARTLAKIQLQSMGHVSHLHAAGCPDRSPLQLADALCSWADSETVKRIFGNEFDSFISALPRLKALCERLSTSKIPLTLVHGDYEQRNVTLQSTKQDELLIFDWQYACISHPFCDMHGLDDLIPEDDEGHDIYTLPDGVRKEYMSMFAMYDSNEADLLEEYNVARVIGKLLLIWSTMECIEECDVQVNSSLQEFVYDCFTSTEARMRRLDVLPGP